MWLGVNSGAIATYCKSFQHPQVNTCINLHSRSAKIMQNCQITLSLFAWKIHQMDDIGKLASWTSSHLRRCPQYVVIPFSLTHKGSFSIVLPIKSKVLSTQLNQPPMKMRDRTYTFGCVHPGCCSSSDVQTTQMPEPMNRSS